jgi:hypothetical protein
LDSTNNPPVNSAYLQQLVEEQRQQIAQMAERLARYEDADSGELASAKRSAIY